MSQVINNGVPGELDCKVAEKITGLRAEPRRLASAHAIGIFAISRRTVSGRYGDGGARCRAPGKKGKSKSVD